MSGSHSHSGGVGGHYSSGASSSSSGAGDSGSSSSGVMVLDLGPATMDPAEAAGRRGADLLGDLRDLSLQPSEPFRLHSMPVTR